MDNEIQYCGKCNDWHNIFHNHIVDFPQRSAEEAISTRPDGTPKEWNSLRLCWV